jgi:hypothetical protein
VKEHKDSDGAELPQTGKRGKHRERGKSVSGRVREDPVRIEGETGKEPGKG